MLRECGGTPHSEDAIGRMVGDGAATLVARAFTAAGVTQPTDALQRFLEVYDSRLLRHTRPYNGVAELLDALSTSTRLAVLTNKPLGATRTILEGLGLARHFEGLVRGGDGPLPRKPDPQGLLALIASAGSTAARTLMVGDSVVDWRTAAAAGANACLARYGFGAHDFPLADLRPCDLAIATPLELLAEL